MKKLYSVRTIILAGSLLLQLNPLCFQSRGAAGDVDLSFDPGFGVNGPVNAVVVQPDGKVIIGGAFTMVKGLRRYQVARLNADGSADPTFNPGTAYNVVSSLALQSDGKVLVGGHFIHYECDESGCSDRHDSIVSRLNADGSLDSSFNPARGTGGDPYGVSSVVVQSDDKVLIGGGFTAVNGTNRIGIARLNANGSLDSSFNPGSEVYGQGFPVVVALQPDGKVLIGGAYSIVTGTNRSGIVRLNADGSLDSSFDPGTGAYLVASVALRPDGKVLIGGDFTSVNGTNRNRIARLNANGSLDGSFDPGAGVFGAGGFVGGVRFIVVQSVGMQSDGKVLIGGNFSAVNGTNRNNIARLNADGSLDSSFNPGTGAGGYLSGVSSVVVQSDGKVLIGGAFITVNGTNRSRIVRLNADGGLDGSFRPGTGLNGTVSSVVVQPDGKVLIGGPFTFINGTNRYGSARLNVDGSVDDTFIPGTFYPDLAGPGPDDYVEVAAVAVQSDGKLLVGGVSVQRDICGDDGCDYSFNTFVTRLNPNGSRDTSFTPFVGQHYLSPEETVQTVACQLDGKVIVSLIRVAGLSPYEIARLNANGILDTSFNASIGPPGSGVSSVVPQADGKLLIGGPFTTVNGTPRNGLARLNSNGSLDNTFNPAVGGFPIALQPDGKVLVGGFARLNADGSLDSFNPGTVAFGNVRSITLQSDGKVLVGGDFTTIKGVFRPYVARLYGDSAPSLNIARSNAFVIVSWPSPSTGFGLQQNTDLKTTNWTMPSETVADNGTIRFISVSPVPGARFYRLFKP